MEQLEDPRGSQPESTGFGDALAQAVSHLKDEPLLSFGVAAAIVVGTLAAVGTRSWFPVAVAGAIVLSVLVAWTLRARPTRASRFRQRLKDAVVGDEAVAQTIKSPAGADVDVTQTAEQVQIGNRARVQTVELTSEPEDLREPR